MVEEVGVPNGADSLGGAAGQTYWEAHFFTLVLVGTAFAFAIGLALIAIELMSRRFSSSPRDRTR